MEPSILQIVDELIDGFIDDGGCELNAQFAIPLPMTVIARMLGLEDVPLASLKKWTDLSLQGMIGSLDNEQRLLTARGILEYQECLLPRIRSRRDEPRDDLLSALVNAQIEDPSEVEGGLVGPRGLTDGEILPIILQVLVGGNETTTCLLGNALVTLIEHPDTMAELRADHSLIENFLEEVLRFDPPVLVTTRVTTEPVQVGATALAPGEVVAMMWGAANQDPQVFPEPRTFDIRRPNAKKHLGFGHGPHFCPGSQLSRAEGRIAFGRLLDRLDDIRLAEGHDLRQTDNFATRGYREIHIAFG
jgi:cytochrome P450